jgi:hypothetical protein
MCPSMAGSTSGDWFGCKLCKPGPHATAERAGLARSAQDNRAVVDLQANDAFRSALNLGQESPRRGPSIRLNHGSAAEQVLAAELKGRDDASDALSMMVSSMVHMVQAGKTRSNGSRWSA